MSEKAYERMAYFGNMTAEEKSKLEAMLMFNDEVLKELKINFQRYIEVIDIELAERKKKKC